MFRFHNQKDTSRSNRKTASKFLESISITRLFHLHGNAQTSKSSIIIPSEIFG